MAITTNQLRVYLKGKGIHCLYCRSSNLEAGKREHEDENIVQDIECQTCGKQWKDVYALVGVIDEKGVR